MEAGAEPLSGVIATLCGKGRNHHVAGVALRRHDAGMCNLYTLKANAAELMTTFAAEQPVNINMGSEDVYPGAPGVVVREDGGARIVQSMTWGFPRHTTNKRTGQPNKPSPMNNIANLDGFPWKFFAAKPDHRCIIPLTAFAEAEGDKGSKARTWFTLKDRPIFAWAGMWKDSDEWGAVYSGLMTNCNEFVAFVHDRMPVLLHEDDYDQWLHGDLEAVRGFQDRQFPSDLMQIERTAKPWIKRKSAPQATFGI